MNECECLDCGHKIKTEEHCDEVECPKCGGDMRRAGRPGPGQPHMENGNSSNDGERTLPWDTKPGWNEIRHRIDDPAKCGSQYARKPVAKGVTLLICKKKDGSGWMNQALRFDKAVFPTITAAKAWYNANWKNRENAIWDLLVKGNYTDDDVKMLEFEVIKMNSYPEKEKVHPYAIRIHVGEGQLVHSFEIEALEKWEIPIEKMLVLSKVPETVDEVKKLNLVWPETTGRLRCNQIEKLRENELVIEQGNAGIGARKECFYEYFLEDDRRILFREIRMEETKEAMNAMLEKIELAEEQKDMIMESFEDRDENIWITWLARDSIPYVLSKRAVEKGWVPPFGHSALPVSLKDSTPDRYHYWEVEDESRRIEVRDSLVNDKEVRLSIIHKYDDTHYLAVCEQSADKQFLIEYEDELPEELLKVNCKSIANIRKLKTEEFVLMHHFWRGKLTLQSQPETEHWDLFIGESQQVVMLSNPIKGRSFVSTRKPYAKKFMGRGKRGLEFVKPKAPGNPTTNTPSYVERMDSGTVIVFEEDNLIKRLIFQGSKLSGLYSMERENTKRNKWEFSKVPVEVGKDLKLSKTQSVKTICLSGEITAIKKLDDGTLEVESVTLGEGVWNCEFYCAEAIREQPERIVGTPVFVGPHSLKGKHGSVTEHKLIDNRDLWTKSHITDVEGIRKLNSGDYKGPSVEVNVIVDDTRHIIEKILRYTRINYVENPACEVCKI